MSKSFSDVLRILRYILIALDKIELGLFLMLLDVSWLENEISPAHSNRTHLICIEMNVLK